MTKSAVVGVHEAKTQFSRLLARVEAGEEIEIARRGHVIAKLVPTKRPRPQLGFDEGKFVVPDDFDDPMPDEWLDLFYNGAIAP